MAEQLPFNFNQGPKNRGPDPAAPVRRMLSLPPLVEGKSELSGTPWAHLNRLPRAVHTIEKQMGFANESPQGPSLKAAVAELTEMAQKECRRYDITWYIGELSLIRRGVAEGRRLSLNQFALLYAMENMMHPPIGNDCLRDVLRTRGEPERYINRCISDLRMIYKKDEWP